MDKSRLAAFSDGVIAIITTIMILELKVPHGDHIRDVLALLPVIFSYVLSFIFVGIYWNNHHHLFLVVEKIDGKVLWANLHLLVWLPLIPFVTDWMGENHFTRWPVFLYGCILLMNALAYSILAAVLMRQSDSNAKLAKALGKDVKGKVLIVIYVAATGLALINPLISLALYAVVALMWLAPDPRVEQVLLRKKSR